MTFVNHLCLITACLLVPNSVIANNAILRGSPVQHINSFPYAVSLQNSAHQHICGGGMINELFVLTAAHCILNRFGHIDIRGLNVLAKTIDLHYRALPAEISEVRNIYYPAEYNSATASYEGDIAVLQLVVPIKHPIRPNNPPYLTIPGIRHYHFNNSLADITGFGRNRRNGLMSNGHLQYALANILFDMDCQAEYRDEIMIDRQKLFCARMHSRMQMNPFGVCHGDDGGLLVQGRDTDAVVIGVLVKIGPNCDEKIHRGHPAIYTRVSYYEQFIYQAMAEQSHGQLRKITLF